MMKIALPNAGDMVNQHFGQSQSFVIATVEDGKVTDVTEVPVISLQHNHGGLSNLLIEQGVSTVITGGIGAPAMNALKEKGLSVIRGASGKYMDILASYLDGQLADQNVVCNHHGDDHHHHHH
jgi:predicted Fe-Mo cluster-binding NifX family protein